MNSALAMLRSGKNKSYKDHMKDFFNQPENDKDIEEVMKNSLSNNQWVKSQARIEDINTTPEEEKRYEMHADFVTSAPDYKTIVKRTEYNQKMDYSCVPLNQQYIVITFIGPDAELYDLQAPWIAVKIWGVFPTLKEANEHIAYIRSVNPYLIFLRMHALRINGAIQVPPSNDGSTETFHVNKEMAEIMKAHLSRVRDNAKSVEDAYTNSVENTSKKNDAVKRFNTMLRNKDTSELQQSTEKFASMTVSDGDIKSMCEKHDDVKDVPTVPIHLVNSFVKCFEQEDTSLGNEYKTEYVRHTTKEGKQMIFRKVIKKNNETRV